MAYKAGITPQQDTGWGVIYRLNDLFREIEVLAPLGKYDEWNFKLDRIWSNLCYRTPLKIIKSEKTEEIISIEFNEDAFLIKQFLDKQILSAKAKMSNAKKKISPERENEYNKEYIKAKKELYQATFLKEVWLRKYMQELGLYLKEVEHNPAGAMFNR